MEATNAQTTSWIWNSGTWGAFRIGLGAVLLGAGQGSDSITCYDGAEGGKVALQLLPDVVFDHAAAARAAAECRAVAARLGVVRDRRHHGAAHAREEWAGASRSDFDTVFGALDRDAEGLHQRLLATAAQIERAATDAATEQRRRDRENDRRREEHRREQERRAAEAAERSRSGGPR